jgi:hypothetical protein
MPNTCATDHSGKMPATFNALPESQGGVGRHKCAACAYELGRNEATATEERLRERVRKLEAELRDLKSKK